MDKEQGKRRPGKPAKKYSQAARLHNVIRLLEARYGATVEELAEECQVDRRTVYRDLQAVSEAGYPLLREPQADGRTLYRFLTGFKKVPPINFSLEELMTRYLCRGQLGFLQGTPFQEDLVSIFDKIRSSLSPRNVAHLERISEAAVPRFQGVRDYHDKKEILEKVRRALLFQYRCRMQYRPPRREVQSYLFDPYLLLFYQSALYLGGYSHNRKALRLFLIDRIQDIEILRERFEVPEDFDASDLTGRAFGLIDDRAMNVEARFGAEVAHLIRERIWHPDQSVVENKDGSLTLSFTAAGEREILSWLYSFLPHVEVLSPSALREKFRDGLKQALHC
jgi:predicted DNA-binding transcriptional regulator YafY